MKLLIVQPYALGPGHYDAYTRRLCRGLCEIGVDVTLVTAAGTHGQWENQLPLKHVAAMKERSFFLVGRKAKQQGNKFIGQIMRKVRFFWTGAVVAYVAFNYGRKNQYNAIHVIDYEPVALGLAFFLAGQPKKIALTIPFSYAPSASPQGFFATYFYNPLRTVLMAAVFQRVVLITHSQFIKESLLQFKNLAYESIPVIPWGIDAVVSSITRDEAREKLGIAKDKVVFGFFGYVLSHKGFDFAIEAWPAVDREATFLAIVHSDKPGEEDRMKEMVKKNNVNDNLLVRFGYASEEELALNLTACDAILVPYKKSFGGESGIMSLAIGHRLPVIVSNTGKIGDTAKKHGLGVLFEAEFTEAFQQAIKKFMVLSEQEHGVLKNNIDSYASLNSWQEVARWHVKAYGEK